MDRATFLRTAPAHLIADLTLYPTDRGGKNIPASIGWGCPCFPDPAKREGWDGWPLLGDEPMRPGDKRRVGFFFLSGELAVEAFRETGRFYLWEGRFVGEARIVGDPGATPNGIHLDANAP